MDQEIILSLSKRLNQSQKHVDTVLSLLEDNTVPFIARYRKEMTGGMDETAIREIDKAYQYQLQLKERKADVIRLIDEKGMLDDELKAKINQATALVDVEDLYRPYKEKKKTKATVAIKKGLEPLADAIMAFNPKFDVEAEAAKFITDEVASVETAIEGASHIIAERVSDHPEYRKWIRTFTFNHGDVVSKFKKNADDPRGVYEGYYDYREPVKRIKLFRVLALNRGEKEKVLSVKIDVDKERVLSYLNRQIIKISDHPAAAIIDRSIADGYKRLIAPSIERELRSELTEKADDHAIHIFSENLEALLLQPPLKGKTVLGIDPAFRTGCKVSVVNAMGTFVDKDVIYPHPKNNGKPLEKELLDKYHNAIVRLVENHKVDVIAIGNGTASRETEAFIVETLKRIKRPVLYTIVNEAGASVYSASKRAKEEFPSLEVEERSAISIARRLQDPLSELVKIDPQSIGVGQYQHDVNQTKLSDSLDFTVEKVVNRVGVNVNTASSALLHYVAGLSKKVAENIVDYREKKSAFKNRKTLLKVKGLGQKGYEQAVGFLRILQGENPLDKTAIHPESYDVATHILSSVDCDVAMVGSDELKEKLRHVKAESFLDATDAGLPTIEDILDALMQPLRDPRDDAPAPILKSDVLSLSDLKEGMKLKGTVRNVVDFGAFVDCGVKEDGLVHISKLKKGFVKHPLDVVKVGDVVEVWVIAVDMDRGRLQLSMVDPTSS